jgi:hypothetical protein
MIKDARPEVKSKAITKFIERIALSMYRSGLVKKAKP